MQVIYRPINKFSFDLFNTLPKDAENVIVSGLSVYCCLNIANLGAKNKTADELNKALHCNFVVNGNEESNNCNGSVNGVPNIHSSIAELLKKWRNGIKDVVLCIANRVLITNAYHVDHHYRNDLKEFYSTDIEPKDFVRNSEEILKECNGWVCHMTKGKIKTILNYVGIDTVLIILNAVYFRGQWKSAFNPKRTELRTFYNFGKEAKEVPMMYQEDVICDCYSFKIGNEEFEVLELPYKGDVYFVIILPKSRTFFNDCLIFDFDAYERRRLTCRTADIMLPKMKFESEYTMNTQLNDLGIKNSFTKDADFTGITKASGVHISRLLHKAVIEVNEEGTEAAAASAIVCDGLSLTKRFFVDHPFIFFIKDKISGVILFVGQVNKL